MRRGRAPCCEKVGLNKGSWTPEEDMRLIAYVQKYGHGNWRALPKLAGLLRCGKSCRLRWINYLRPDIKRGNFSKEEEETIIKLHGLLGNKWSKIASCLPGRTDNEIKNVWNTHLKKRLAAQQQKLTVDDDHINKPEDTPSGASSSITSHSSSCDHNETKSDDIEQATNPSVDSKTSLGILIEIPTEPNMDLWEDIMLDDHPLYSPQYSQDKFGSQIPASSSSEFDGIVDDNDSEGRRKMISGINEPEVMGSDDGLVIEPELLNMIKDDEDCSSLSLGIEAMQDTSNDTTFFTTMDDHQHPTEGSKEWLEYIEKELGLWDNQESFVNNVVVELEGDPVANYFQEQSHL